jgi:hypothetical protein
MTTRKATALAVTLVLLRAVAVAAQPRPWAVEATIGHAGLVDDATKHYGAAGVGLRRYVTPRLSIGPEIVVMWNGELIRNRILIATGNMTFDLYQGTRRMTPFVVGGFGVFMGHEDFPTGPFRSSDPAFTAGGGVRAMFGDRFSLAGEYRVGWELHQRVSATAGFHW